MPAERIQSNTSTRVWFKLLDSNGDPVTGLTGAQLDMLTLTRQSDGKYYDGAAWQVNKTDLAVTEYNAVGSPGMYYYDTLSLPEDTYVVEIDTDDAENPDPGEIIAGGYVDNLDSKLSEEFSRQNALAGENIRLFNTVYDSFGNLTSGIKRGYASKADLEADTNHIFEIAVTGVYTAANIATTFTQKDST